MYDPEQRENEGRRNETFSQKTFSQRSGVSSQNPTQDEWHEDFENDLADHSTKVRNLVSGDKRERAEPFAHVCLPSITLFGTSDLSEVVACFVRRGRDGGHSSQPMDRRCANGPLSHSLGNSLGVLFCRLPCPFYNTRRP